MHVMTRDGNDEWMNIYRKQNTKIIYTSYLLSSSRTHKLFIQVVYYHLVEHTNYSIVHKLFNIICNVM